MENFEKDSILVKFSFRGFLGAYLRTQLSLNIYEQPILLPSGSNIRLIKVLASLLTCLS